MTALSIISLLQLQPHPEGGFYKETYRSPGSIASKNLPSQFNGERQFSTAIYFLLQQGDFSAFHRIKSDECWHFYEGKTIIIHVINEAGEYAVIYLGRSIEKGEVYQAVVPAGAWFASEPGPGTDYALVGCTVAPGFDFRDFEMADKKAMIHTFPQQEQLLNRLCR